MNSNADEKKRELEALRVRARELEEELSHGAAPQPFRPEGFYTGYHATAGFVLGIFGAMASLLFNVVGSLFVGQHPLELIRVYLTFPLGDRALEIDTGLTLAIGCCLYLGTGMVLGVLFQLVLARWAPDGPLSRQLVIASVLALVIWFVNYYAILSWLQADLIDMSPQNYIVSRVPWWVAALTHLVFGWTMALVYPLGRFVPYRRVTETEGNS